MGPHTCNPSIAAATWGYMVMLPGFLSELCHCCRHRYIDALLLSSQLVVWTPVWKIVDRLLRCAKQHTGFEYYQLAI
jgi:hypothetical protein